MDFETLLNRLLERLRTLVHNGEMTERGLARQAGLSQSHIHNVLQGRRSLTSQTADVILTTLKLSVWDLVDGSEPQTPERGQRPDAERQA